MYLAASCGLKLRFSATNGQECDLGNLAKTPRFCVCVWKATKCMFGTLMRTRKSRDIAAWLLQGHSPSLHRQDRAQPGKLANLQLSCRSLFRNMPGTPTRQKYELRCLQSRDSNHGSRDSKSLARSNRSIRNLSWK